MAIRKVARLGHPVLRAAARDLSPKEITSTEIQRLIEDMRETMAEYGGIGLAAPQIHEPIRLTIIEFDEGNERYPNIGHQGLLVIINPKVEVLDKRTQSFWEGCLSVPGMRGLVARPRKIRVEYLNEKAEKKEIVAEDFLATVFQHEIDHLDGVLYVDRIESKPGKTPFAYNEEYLKFLAPQSDDDDQELPD